MKYRPDLDGLRALAVLGVVANHMFLPTGLPAGVVGVVAFFVLSGYLITNLLLAEREGTGRVAIRAFYARRVRRLAPGLVSLLSFVTLVGVLGIWRLPWLEGVVWSLFYLANVGQSAGVDMGPLAQTWTLGIEEQFYLVWPLVALAGGRRGIIVASVGAIAVGIVLSGGLNYMTAIALGALVAALRIEVRPATATLGLVTLGVTCLLSTPTAIHVTTAAIAAAVVVAGRTPIGLLAPVGKRAYEIYLWDFTLTTLFGSGIGGLLAFPAAELTYRATARFRRRRSDDLDLRDPHEAGHRGSSPAGTRRHLAGPGPDPRPDGVGV